MLSKTKFLTDGTNRSELFWIESSLQSLALMEETKVRTMNKSLRRIRQRQWLCLLLSALPVTALPQRQMLGIKGERYRSLAIDISESQVPDNLFLDPNNSGGPVPNHRPFVATDPIVKTKTSTKKCKKKKETKIPSRSPAPTTSARPSKRGLLLSKSTKGPSVTESPTKSTPKTTKAPSATIRPTLASKIDQYCEDGDGNLILDDDESEESYAPSASPYGKTALSARPTTQQERQKNVCDRIIANQQENVTVDSSTPSVDFTIQMTLLISDDPVVVIERLQMLLQGSVGPFVAGCSDQRRFLQELTITNIIFHVRPNTTASVVGKFRSGCDSRANSVVLTFPFCFLTATECDANATNGTKTCLNLDIFAQIFHLEGANTTGFEIQLRDAILSSCDEIKNLEGVEATFNPCSTIVVVGNYGNDPNGGGSNGQGGGGVNGTEIDLSPSLSPSGYIGVAAVQSQQTVDKGLSAGGTSAIVATGLLCVLFLAFFLRRKHRDDASLKHHYLEDGLDEETYLKESETSSSNERGLFVVGEEDSMMSARSGYTNGAVMQGESPLYSSSLESGPDRSLADYHYSQDVHHCTSAMCKVCERQRQRGLQFVPTGMPSHGSMRSPNSSRSYASGDTVDL
jgi:hypothetical protein